VTDDWDINIKRVRNGFIVGGTNDIGFPFEEVIAERVDEPPDKAEAKIARDLCYYIVEYFGMGGSKHNQYRINITVGGDDE
jgi:hypothetical protein